MIRLASPRSSPITLLCRRRPLWFDQQRPRPCRSPKSRHRDVLKAGVTLRDHLSLVLRRRRPLVALHFSPDQINGSGQTTSHFCQTSLTIDHFPDLLLDVSSHWPPDKNVCSWWFWYSKPYQQNGAKLKGFVKPLIWDQWKIDWKINGFVVQPDGEDDYCCTNQ